MAALAHKIQEYRALLMVRIYTQDKHTDIPTHTASANTGLHILQVQTQAHNTYLEFDHRDIGILHSLQLIYPRELLHQTQPTVTYGLRPQVIWLTRKTL